MSTEWPLGEGVRVPARPQRGRRRPLPRVTWVLAAAAFLVGALVSAAAFSIGWHQQAQEQTSVQSALDAATARDQRLTASLATVRATAARARRAESSATAAARAVSSEAAKLATALAATGRSADSVSLGASSLGGDLGKLAGELRTLTSYLGSTPTGQLDSGYVATQTAYISKQLDRLTSEQGDLASAVAQFESGAKTLADRAAALAGRN